MLAAVAVTRKQQILQQLNEQQKRPVVEYRGPSYALAGPGSGKTRTIIARIAYMVEDGVPPAEILVFTFTRKAAEELRSRVENEIGDAAGGVTVGTYHSICARLLRRYATSAGYRPNFTIYDEADRMKMLKRVCEPELEPEFVAEKISRWKECMVNPAEALRLSADDFEAKSAHKYAEYQRQMREQNAMDFDDLVYQAVRLLSLNKHIQLELHKKYKFIMADETQDSSMRDVLLIELLTGKNKNTFVVFDEAQSIYSFRGASMPSLNEFLDRLGFRKYILGQNYRSTRTIVEASSSLIRHAAQGEPKFLFTDNPVGDKVVLTELPTALDEANHVVKTIMAMRKLRKLEWQDMTVLYRVSAQSRLIEEVLIRNQVPYTIIGGLPFFARKEIKDIMCYLRFLHNPRDREAFERILNTPKRGLGDKTLNLIIGLSNRSSCDMLYLQSCKELYKVSKGKQKTGLYNLIETLEKISRVASIEPAQIIKSVVEWTGYEQYLLDSEDAEARLANVAELINLADRCGDLEDLLHSASLSMEPDSEQDLTNRVKLMTMHASKGLEFPVVIAIGLNEGTLPHKRCLNADSIEEERRLFYVAMTRAEKYLFITRPRSIYTAGAPKFPKASRFLTEIDPKYLLRVAQDREI